MASITGKSSTYKEGHQVQLAANLKVSAAAMADLKRAGYVAGKSTFTIIRNVRPSFKISNIIHVVDGGKDELVLKDEKNRYALFQGSVTSIDKMFIHAGEGASAKAETTVKTEIKEKISMWVFEEGVEKGSVPSEDSVLKKLEVAQKKFYSSVYYESAVKQLKALRQRVKGKGYIYERQRDNLTGPLYDLGRRLSQKGNDNWNPADVWMIKKDFDMKSLLRSTTANELNDGISAAIKSQDLIPISLKQVEGPTAKFSIVDPNSVGEADPASKMDFSFKKVDLSESFNNFILWTNSGFGIRVGYKAAATNFNVFLEGRMEGAGSQIGAVDKKAFVKYVLEKYNYTLRFAQTAPPDSDQDIAKKELKELFGKYPRISNKLMNEQHTLEVLTKSPKFVQQRFSNIISFMTAMLVEPGSPKGVTELMKYCYYSAKKMTGGASMYVLIN